MNIAREAGDRFGVSRAIHYLVICSSALGEFSQAAEYREEYLKIVNGVGGHTEGAEEGRSCIIHGNSYQHFCEFRKQLAYLLVQLFPSLTQYFAIHYSAKMCILE